MNKETHELEHKPPSRRLKILLRYQKSEFFHSFTAGDIKVTLAVFSGRADPEWMVFSSDTVNYNAIQKLLGDARGKFLYLPEQMPPRLGYKGFLVQEGKEEHLILGGETMQLQLLLLSTLPAGFLLKDDIEDIKVDIASGTIKAEVDGARLKRYAHPFDRFGVWGNKRAKLCNNCYNYANIRISSNYAQPGFGSGQRFTEYTTANIVAAAVRDGLEALNPPITGC